MNTLRREFADLGKQLPAIGHVGIIRLIGSKETPDRFQFAQRFGRIHLDRDREGLRLLRFGCDGSDRENEQSQSDNKEFIEGTLHVASVNTHAPRASQISC